MPNANISMIAAWWHSFMYLLWICHHLSEPRYLRFCKLSKFIYFWHLSQLYFRLKVDTAAMILYETSTNCLHKSWSKYSNSNCFLKNDKFPIYNNTKFLLFTCLIRLDHRYLVVVLQNAKHSLHLNQTGPFLQRSQLDRFCNEKEKRK